MADPGAVFIADTCIGGLSVLKSMWGSGYASHARFMADYEVNPLGVKSDAAIADVVEKWMSLAAAHSDTMVIACNTLSIRHRQLAASMVASPDLNKVVSMVDCLEAMIGAEMDLLSGKRILVIGTEFTANQSLYPDILKASVPGASVSTVAATELERRIARFLPWDGTDESVLTSDLRQVLDNTDIAVLACTCFPMARAELESMYPGVTFMDPGAYCSGLLERDTEGQRRKLSITVEGDIVSQSRVNEFAKSYLGRDYAGL